MFYDSSQATHPILHFEIANAWSCVKQSNNSSGRGDGVEEGKEREGGGGGGIERSYMEKGFAGGGWSTYKYEQPSVQLSGGTEDERNNTFRPITVKGGDRQDAEVGGQGQGQVRGQGINRGWRHTDSENEDMGEGAANATQSTSSKLQTFASTAMKSISTTLSSTLTSTSTSRPIHTYAIHQNVSSTDGDENRSANRRGGRDRGDENGALSSQMADEETVTF